MTIHELLLDGFRAGVRAIAQGVSDAALADIGLRRGGLRDVAGPLLASFGVGAAAGVALMLFAAPGSADSRRLLASRLRHARDVLADAELDLEDGLAKVRDRALAMVKAERTTEAELAGPGPAQG